MHKFNSKTYPIALRAIAFCVLIGLLWTNAASYYAWMTDPSCFALEIYDPLDGENEKKEMEQKLDDKVRTEIWRFAS